MFSIFKSLPLSFLSCGIRMHIPILRGVQIGYISGEKNGHNFLKVYFCSLIFNININCMPVACFILLTANAFFFSPQVVAYLCTFSFQQGFPKDTLVAIKMVTFCKKCTFEA